MKNIDIHRNVNNLNIMDLKINMVYIYKDLKINKIDLKIDMV